VCLERANADGQRNTAVHQESKATSGAWKRFFEKSCKKKLPAEKKSLKLCQVRTGSENVVYERFVKGAGIRKKNRKTLMEFVIILSILE